jgi:general secretion pathway protein G
MISLKKDNRGFTIVELLIVIVVIGILAGLVITTYNGIQQKARNTERTTDLKTLQAQLEAYFAENDSHYPSLTDLNTQPATGTWWITTNMKGMDKETLRDPSNSRYQLASTPTAKQYSYQVFQSDGTTSCETDDTTCATYTLTAEPEGSGANIVYKSLN